MSRKTSGWSSGNIKRRLRWTHNDQVVLWLTTKDLKHGIEVKACHGIYLLWENLLTWEQETDLEVIVLHTSWIEGYSSRLSPAAHASGSQDEWRSSARSQCKRGAASLHRQAAVGPAGFYRSNSHIFRAFWEPSKPVCKWNPEVLQNYWKQIIIVLGNLWIVGPQVWVNQLKITKEP